MSWFLWSDKKGQHLFRKNGDIVADVPMDEANSDYQQYLAWLAEGNTPEPWENQ